MRQYILLLTLGVGACIGLTTTSHAANPTLQRFAEDLRGLDGRFEQTVTDEQGRVRERSQGRVALALPRLFRWDVDSPYPQTIVADGERVWIYDPDLEQVTVRRQEEQEQGSPLAVLIDPAELERRFAVESVGSAGGLDWLRLVPRAEEPAFSVCELAFEGTELVLMRLTDTLGQRTEIAFRDWRRNPEFATGTFRFEPPPGADVVGDVEGVAPTAEAFPIQD